MKKAFFIGLFLCISSTVFAFDKLPTSFEVLLNPAGPSVVMQMGLVQASQMVAAEKCNAFAAYRGDTALTLGDQVYKLTYVGSSLLHICKTYSDFKDFSQLILIFENTKFHSQVRLVLDRSDFPYAELVMGPGAIYPVKVLN